MIDLCGEWLFRENGTNDCFSANVPGSNYQDLLRLGMIEDPFQSDNEKKDFWIAEKDWEYMRTFEYYGEGRAQLIAQQLDTICEIYLNDVLVGEGNNSHIEYRIDITETLVHGKNTIRFIFRSPIEYVRKKQTEDEMPNNPNNEVTGIPHIRKAQCNFGWDWGPNLPLSGITGKIYIESFDARISDVFIRQRHEDHKVAVTISGKSDSYNQQNCKTHVTLFSPKGKKLAQFSSEAAGWQFTAEIEKPELWWTYELSQKSEQPLYNVLVEVMCADKILCKKETRIGLRTIELCRDNDQWGRDFCFILNGVRIFAKGGDLIPADSFMSRQTESDISGCVESVVRANMNMIRIWGGGYYGCDALYKECDQRGVLIWQDFMFACEPYPFYNHAFLDNVKREIACNVKRLRNHPSLALWCGNNEIETMSKLWPSFTQLQEWTEKFFYHILPEELARYDDITPYVAGTPNGDGYMSNISNDGYGDTHLWQVWHGLRNLQYYRTRYTRFCSEFGLESFPDMRTLREYLAERDLSFYSKAMLIHQKCKNGNGKMLFYTAARFRIAKNFEDSVALTQIVQSEGVRDASEHWRRNRGRCNGAIWWQLNDCWPVASWSSIDYRGRYKALQYNARHFFAPQCVSLQNNGVKSGVWVINDLNVPLIGCLKIQIMEFSGSVLYEKKIELTVPPLAAAEQFAASTVWIRGRKKRNAFLLVRLYDENAKEISRRTALFVKENRARLPKPVIETNITLDKEGRRVLCLKSNVFARFVHIRQKQGIKPLEDNFFDLLPNEKSCLTIPDDAKDLDVRSFADIEPKSTRLYDLLIRLASIIIPNHRAQG